MAVFADGDDLKKAEVSGADIYGSEDLIEKVKKGEINLINVFQHPK